MEFNIKSLGVGIITVIIASLLAVSILIPVTLSAQEVAGSEITYTNEWQYGPNMKEYKLSEEFTITAGTTANSIVVNGEQFTPTIHAPIFMSDGGIIYESTSYLIAYFVLPGEVSTTTISCTFGSTQTFNFTASNGIATVSNGTNTQSFEYTWSYAYDGEGEYNFVSRGTPGGSDQTKSYYKNEGDFVFCGDYTTGNNDTFYYSYKGGKGTAAGYNIEVSLPGDKVNGTTDIYKLTDKVVLTIGDETFTPYNCLVKSKITGHESSGATYSLVGLIPILVLAGLVIGVVGMFISRRD